MSLVYDNMNETNFAGLSHHEEMLSDAVRADAYHRGIHRNVRPGDVVLDLGTGTGLLAFMASRGRRRQGVRRRALRLHRGRPHRSPQRLHQRRVRAGQQP